MDQDSPKGEESLSTLINKAHAGDHTAGRELMTRFIRELRQRPAGKGGTVRVPADLAIYIAARLEDAMGPGDARQSLRIKNPSYRPKDSDKASRQLALAVEVMMALQTCGGLMQAYEKVAHRNSLSAPTVRRALRETKAKMPSHLQALVRVKDDRADLCNKVMAELRTVQRERKHSPDAKHPLSGDVAEVARRLSMTREKVRLYLNLRARAAR